MRDADDFPETYEDCTSEEIGKILENRTKFYLYKNQYPLIEHLTLEQKGSPRFLSVFILNGLSGTCGNNGIAQTIVRLEHGEPLVLSDHQCDSEHFRRPVFCYCIKGWK